IVDVAQGSIHVIHGTLVLKQIRNTARNPSQQVPVNKEACLRSLNNLLMVPKVEAMVKYLHASDVRHLGQASRGIRMSVYTHIGAYALSEGTKIGTLRSLPSEKKTPLWGQDFLVHANRAELLSRDTCEHGQKDRFWSCDIQICSVCSHRSQVSATGIQHHVDTCTLYCHKCHFREICAK
ncbi:MAG: hypothetical protein LQ345_006494, partial [Seirophora villosa]